jgi:UDP-3-O-[3-hydroxymyristoyl] glucosamine N-acyltransferase
MQPQKKGVDSSAFIAKNAVIGEAPYIGAYTVIEPGVKIGDHPRIYPHVYIGDNVRIGSNVTIYAGAKIYKDCIIGNNCIIHAGAVIGSDGFGFAPDESGVYNKIPQMGNVVIEDNVEIGANTTIDRATMGSTLIKKGVKLDNLIQIAHNVEVGEDTVMAALVGVDGSSKIGKRCMFGGQAGVVGHLSIADGSVFAARTGVSCDIKEPNQAFHNYPHMKARDFQKSHV